MTSSVYSIRISFLSVTLSYVLNVLFFKNTTRLFQSLSLGFKRSRYLETSWSYLSGNTFFSSVSSIMYNALSNPIAEWSLYCCVLDNPIRIPFVLCLKGKCVLYGERSENDVPIDPSEELSKSIFISYKLLSSY